MSGRTLIKRIIAGALAIGCVGYAWHIFDQEYGQRNPAPKPIAKKSPNPNSARPSSRPVIARNMATRPVVQVRRAPLDPNQIPEPLRRLEGHTDTLRCVALSPDNTKLLTGGNDRTVRIWDLATGNLLHTFEGHHNFVLDARFSSDGARIISASADQTIRVWDVGGEQLAQLEGHQGSVVAAAFLSDPNLAISASKDGTARIWNIDQEKTIYKFEYNNLICAMGLSLPHNLVALGTHSGHVYLLDLKSRTQLREFDPVGGCIKGLFLSADGKKLVICPLSKPARVVDTQSGKVLFKEQVEEEQQQQQKHTAAFSPDGRYLALGSTYQINFYDLQTFKPFKTFIQSNVFSTHAMCFVPDRPLLITAGGGIMTGDDTWLAPRRDKLLVWKLPQPLP